MVIKPQYLESDIWANAASPTDVRRPTIDGSVEDTFTAKGWEYAEKPPYMFENWLNQHKDLMLVHINQNGIPHWDDKTVYTNKARVLFDDGTGTLAYVYQPDPYIEPTAGTPEPKSDNSTDWKVDISLTPDNIVIKSTGPADAGKIVMTNTDGKVHESLISLGVLQFRGAIDITNPPPTEYIDGSGYVTPLENGDFYTIVEDAVYHAGFAPLSGNGYKGEGIVAYNVTAGVGSWARIGSGVNNNYLLRDGSLPMESGTSPSDGRLILAHLDAISDLEATPKKYVDDVNNTQDTYSAANYITKMEHYIWILHLHQV